MDDDEWEQLLERVSRQSIEESADLLALEQRVDAMKAAVAQLPPSADPSIRALLEAGVADARIANENAQQFVAINALLAGMADAIRGLDQRVRRLEG